MLRLCMCHHGTDRGTNWGNLHVHTPGGVMTQEYVDAHWGKNRPPILPFRPGKTRKDHRATRR